GGDGSLYPCGDHPEFRGLTKRGKCSGCAAVYRGACSLRAKIKDLRTRAAKGRARIKSLGPTFKETSDDHWRYLLFDPNALGLVPVAFTDKKALPKVDDDSLEALQRGHPEVQVLSARVGLQHALHTKGVLEVPVDANGRAHFVLS